MEDIKQYEEELNKILKGCNTCKAKMCNICPNGKRKKFLKGKIKEILPKKETWLKKIKSFFK